MNSTIINAIVINALLAIAHNVRSALDYASRHFGKQTVEGWTKQGGTVTAPEGADADKVRDFSRRLDGQVRSHLDSLKLATAMAKSANVTFSAFCKELETVRLAELERIKAEAAAAEAMKASKGAKTPKTADTAPTVAKAA